MSRINVPIGRGSEMPKWLRTAVQLGIETWFPGLPRIGIWEQGSYGDVTLSRCACKKFDSVESEGV